MDPSMSPDANTAFAGALVDEWVRAGVTDACVAPGSRNAPLALALAADPRVRVHPHLDERAAGFFALGAARGSGRPVVVCCTSGTAPAHLHPAVLEAWHGGVPLLVCTADRPPELRDTGAGQTIDQVGLYGGALRWACDVDAPADRPGAGTWWRALGARAAAEALGPPAGPVHLNLAFREPLAPTAGPLVDAPGRADGQPWTVSVPAVRQLEPEAIAELAAVVRRTRRGVIVAGWGAEVDPAVVSALAARAGWPVLADPLSGLRVGPQVCPTADALLRAPAFAAAHVPDLVLRLGAAPTSAATVAWLAGAADTWLVDPDARWLDPTHAATRRLAADPAPFLASLLAALDAAPPATPWLDGWLEADRRARRAIAEQLAGSEEPFEGRIARDVVAALPSGATLVVASSMPVRDVEAFAEPRADVRFVANRGVNGIDGYGSTTLGVAAVSQGPTVGLTGDLSFLHDANALLGVAGRGLDAVFVVVDNDGGGIFSFLPYAQRVAPEPFEQVLATPPGVDLAEVAAAHGVAVTEVEKASQLAPALLAAIDTGGVRVVRVHTDRAANVARHDEVWAAVASALAA
jgi:2-succinyl-5-enolpyruvyl-6-hydroxy-3-cyclohexene-1-carboxylate synthase